METEPEQNAFKSSLNSNTSLKSQMNVSPFSPISLSLEKNEDFSQNPSRPLPPIIKRLDFGDLMLKNSTKKPPIIRKSQITCPNLTIKEKLGKLAELKGNQMHKAYPKELSNSVYNDSTDNSSELKRTSRDSLQFSTNINIDFKGFKFASNDETQSFNMNSAQRIDEIFQKPSASQRNILMNLNNKKFEEFFNSPNVIISRKYSENDKILKTSSIFGNEFENLAILGKGHFSSVHKCRHKRTGLIYAIKITKNSIKTVKSSGQILNEAQILAFLSSYDDNPNIVKYYNSWFEEKELYIQMEYCDNSLDSLAKHHVFSEKELIKILKDLCLGLRSLHKNKVVHLDIKPENILHSKEKNIYKLADMGLSRFSSVSKGEDIIEGDSRYLALELLNINFNEMTDLTKADIFSLGASMYELMIKSNLPKFGEDWQKIRRGDLEKLDLLNEYSKTLRKIIKNMMNPNFKSRPSCEEILRKKIFLSEAENEFKLLKFRSNILEEETKVFSKILKTKEKRRKSLF